MRKLSMLSEDQIRIALPSLHSRLHIKAQKLLKLPLHLDSQQLVYHSSEAIIYFLRPWDIPMLVESGLIDVAFCGYDTIIELNVDILVKERFQEMQAPIALCKPSDLNLNNGISIATEYYNITNNFLSNKFKRYKIIKVRGASEAYPYLDGISAIVDIVETGNTIKKNKLELFEIITYTYPCLIQTKKRSTLIEINIENLSKIIRKAIKQNFSFLNQTE